VTVDTKGGHGPRLKLRRKEGHASRVTVDTKGGHGPRLKLRRKEGHASRVTVDTKGGARTQAEAEDEGQRGVCKVWDGSDEPQEGLERGPREGCRCTSNSQQ